MASADPRVFRALVAAARDFIGLELWDELESDECLALEVPGEEHTVYASIMGQGGEEFGLALFCGGNARNQLLDMLHGEGFEGDLLEEGDSIAFSVRPFGELTPEMRGAFDRTGMRFGPEGSRPLLHREAGRAASPGD